MLSKLYHSFPSISCFNRSVVSIIPLLTGVSSKCFHFAKFILLPSISNRSVVTIDPYRSLYISFQSECLHVPIVHCNTFLMSLNLQGSSKVPCSSSLIEVSTLFTFVVFFSQIFSTSQGSLVSLNCQRSNLVLLVLFLFCFPPVPS